MNTFELLEQFGNIDGSYIEEAFEMKKVKRNTKRLFLTYLAAALAIGLLTLTVYAAISYLGIADMKKTRGKTSSMHSINAFSKSDNPINPLS